MVETLDAGLPLGIGAHLERWGVPAGAELVVSISRLVPRKGMDVLVDAARPTSCSSERNAVRVAVIFIS